MNRKRVSDERWVTVLEALQQWEDPRELVRALVIGGAVPIWVRAQLKFWLNGKLPPDPILSEGDWKLLQAARAYRRSPSQPREKRPHKIARIAEEHGVGARALQGILDQQGRAWMRIRSHLRRPFP